MGRQYKDLCGEYRCNAKVYPKRSGIIKRIGNPDLPVLFTGTASHKTVRHVLAETKGQDAQTVRRHSGSLSARKRILEENINREVCHV